MKRDVGVSFSFQGRRHAALSISRLSPIVRLPFAPRVKYMASLIRRPLIPFTPPTFFHRRHFRSLRCGSSSSISRLRHSFKLSELRFLFPPGNVQRPSRRRLTSKTRLPSFAATTSFAAFGFCLMFRSFTAAQSQCSSLALRKRGVPSARRRA
jgi:hypothetical protein